MKLIPLAATAAALLASPAVHAASVTLVPSSGPNISVQAGGGVLDYRSGLSAITNAGGAWDVRAVIGARVGYRFLFNDKVRTDLGSANAQSIDATARLGFAF